MRSGAVRGVTPQEQEQSEMPENGAAASKLDVTGESIEQQVEEDVTRNVGDADPNDMYEQEPELEDGVVLYSDQFIPTAPEAAAVLFSYKTTEELCSAVPQRCPYREATFLVSLRDFKEADLRVDGYGTWGNYHARRTFFKREDDETIRCLGKTCPDGIYDFCVRQFDYVHKATKVPEATGKFLKKIYVALDNNDEPVTNFGIISYMWEGTPFSIPLYPHGNTKREAGRPFQRMLPSQRDQMKLLAGSLKPADALKVLEEHGNPCGSLRDLRQIRAAVRKNPETLLAKNKRTRPSPHLERLRQAREARSMQSGTNDLDQLYQDVIEEKAAKRATKSMTPGGRTINSPRTTSVLSRHPPGHGDLEDRRLKLAKRRKLDAETDVLVLTKQKLLYELEILKYEYQNHPCSQQQSLEGEEDQDAQQQHPDVIGVNVEVDGQQPGRAAPSALTVGDMEMS